MDPGTAVGVVSLGIQVCQGLIEYYHDWAGYQDDIREVTNSISSLKKTLAILEEKLQAVSQRELATRAIECLSLCKDGIEKLNAKLKKLRKETPSGLRQKAQASALRLMYPFRRSTLAKLKEIVDSLMQELNLAIQVIILDDSSETRGKATRIESSITGIEDVTAQLHAAVLQTKAQVEATATNVQTLQRSDEAGKLKDILRWLSAADPKTNHTEARMKHEPGTGEWLLKSRKYQKWIEGSSPRLWLHGKAGCCKTVLCSTIIEDVLHRVAGQPNTRFAYFYFTFSDIEKQNYLDLLISVVTELSRGHTVHNELLAVYDDTYPHKPTADVAERLLIAILQSIGTSYLVVDALDECSEEQREHVLRGLKRVTEKAENTRLLITSRKLRDIENIMREWDMVPLPVEEGSVNEDIDTFIRNALATDKKLIKLPEATKKEIQDVFHEKSDGMFRWAAMQLHSLTSLKLLRPSYISAALHTMPRTLDMTYERVLSDIDEIYFEEARATLEWLAFSERPMTMAEPAEACSIRLHDGGKTYLEDGGEEALEGLMEVIAPLVLIKGRFSHKDWKSGVYRSSEDHPRRFRAKPSFQSVRLAHFSVKEYLLSGRLKRQESEVSRYAFAELEANRNLSERCCAYLLYFTEQTEIMKWIAEEFPPKEDLKSYPWEKQDYLTDFASLYPLLQYAVSHWHVHAAFVEESIDDLPTMSSLHLRILGDEKTRVSWLRLVDPTPLHERSHPRTRLVSRPKDFLDNKETITESSYNHQNNEGIWHDDTKMLYWASLLGLSKSVSFLCSPIFVPDLDHVAGRYGTALQAAAYQRQERIVDILLDAGARADIQAGVYGTAVQAAALSGSDKIVDKLLRKEQGIVNVKGGLHGSALQAAAFNGHKHIVLRLLHGGANVDLGGGKYCTPLQAATYAGHVSVVRTLLDFGADPNIKGGQYMTALLAAVKRNDYVIAEMLLQAGADAYIEDDRPVHGAVVNALNEAVLYKEGKMIELILKKGANFQSSQYTLEGLLLNAIIRTDIIKEHVAKLLIDKGARITHEIFRVVAERWHGPPGEPLAEFLIMKGLKVDGESDPLIAAIYAGWENTTRLLVREGASIHGRSTFHTGQVNALMAAAEIGSETLVQFLLEMGANAKERYYVRNSGWNGRRIECRTALSRAIYYGRNTHSDSRGFKDVLRRVSTIVQKLIDAGANIHEGGDDSLYEAMGISQSRSSPSRNEIARIISLLQLLSKHGAKGNAAPDSSMGKFRCSILYYAVHMGSLELVQYLVACKADVNGLGGRDDNNEEAVLFAAAKNWEPDMLEELIRSGADIKTLGTTEVCKLLVAPFLRWEAHPNDLCDGASIDEDYARASLDMSFDGDMDTIKTLLVIAHHILSLKGPDAPLIDEIIESSTLDTVLRRYTWLPHWQEKISERIRSVVSERRSACLAKDSEKKHEGIS